MPRLESLANEQDSRYHLLDWNSKEYWAPDRYVAEGLLPPLDTHGSKEPNSSILILANAAMSTSKLPDSQSFAKGSLKLVDWSRDIRTGSGFHAGGPVRMLYWCPEKEKTPILPRTFKYRTKLSLMLEMTCHVEEIVTSDISIGQKYQKRDQSIELMSGRRVAKSMKQLGIEIPAERRTELQRQIQQDLAKLESGDTTLQASNASLRTRGWHRELQDLQAKFDAGEFVQAEGAAPRARKKYARNSTYTPEYARLLELERNARHSQKRVELVEELLEKQAKIDSLDLQAHDSTLGEPARAAALTELRQRKNELEQDLANTKGIHTRQEFEYFKHDRRAYAQDPPLLMWDRRNADPLKADTEEFHPAKGLCLFDIEPRCPFPYSMTPAQDSVFSALMTTLWYSSSENLTVLDQITPGAFDALTPNVPALRDPRRGGELDLRDLPLRRLTPEMAYGLAMAWLDWPFKPDFFDLLRKGSLYDEAHL